MTCEEDSNVPSAAPAGARVYTFEVGRPLLLVRDPTGREFSPVGSTREISVVFDSTGRPLMVVDLTEITRWRHGTVAVFFPIERAAFGFRQVAQIDSAAAIEGVREGLSVQEASRQATQAGPQERLDSAMVARATDLASHLWAMRCRRGRAKG